MNENGYQDNERLFKEYNRGDNLKRKQIIENNLGLVKRIASSFSIKTNVPYDDLYQEGCYGLIKAVDKFDLSMGVKFTTYAFYFISGDIKKYLYKNKKLYIPTYKLLDIIRYKKFKDKGFNDIEIAEIMNLNQDKIEKLKEDVKIYDSISIVSIETKIYNSDDNEQRTIGDDISIDSDSDLDIAISNFFSLQVLQEMKKILTEKEMKIICMRYGLNNCKKLSQNAVASQFGTTRQNIANIEKYVKRKLKLSKSIQKFYEDM